ncbi:hypothetical protein RZE82_00040 [Mollicutes bacterium LVI A0039]|nr:hypothetical protein RZE82_00040 [Mollicutes bacterium LVI A0039]
MNYFNLLKSQTKLKKQIVFSLLPIILLNAIVPLLVLILDLNMYLELFAIFAVTGLWIIKQIQVGAVPIINEYQKVESLSAMRIIILLITAIPLILLLIFGFTFLISLVTVPAFMLQSIAIPSMIASTLLAIALIFSLMLIIVAFVDHLLDPSKSLTKHYLKNYKHNLKRYAKDLFVYALLLLLISTITYNLAIPISNPIVAFIGSLAINLILTIVGVWFDLTFVQLAAQTSTGKGQ